MKKICVPVVSVLLTLFTLSVCARERAAPVAAIDHAITEIGTRDGSGYRIDIPANWNHGLVVFFHGYSVEPIRFEKGERLSPMFDPIVGKGYALIQSAYSATGWAVEQGGADTERLRRWFVTRFGKPKEAFVMGMSMGGTLTVMAIETSPTAYDGALSLCGALEPTNAFMQRDFALRAAFDYYFPGVFGELVPVSADYTLARDTIDKVKAAMRSNPKATAAIRSLYGAGTSANLPDVIAFITYDVKEMQQRTNGNPFGNEDLIYTGTDDDFALNDGVKRYRADPRAAAYMARWYTPTGKLLKPMLALHDTGDPLVTASSAFEYALIAQRAGHGDNFVQRYVNAEGHCVFTPAQIGNAFDELVDWSRTGKRPQSGRMP
jgi:pimeloyl-ACP methyl ester carboxylesterase